MIEDAHDKDEELTNCDYDECAKWAIQPRIVKRKGHMRADATMHVKTIVKACGLHVNEKEYCDAKIFVS